MKKNWLASTRVLQIGLLILLLVSVAQLVWWIYEEFRYSREVVAQAEQGYRAELEAGRELVAMGREPADVAALLEDLVVDEKGNLQIDPERLAAPHVARDRRLNRFMWEGGFFLLVLVGGMGILVRALRQDWLLRRRQQNVLAAVSHEFKSPLAGARLAAETLVLRDPPPEKRREIVQRILGSLDRLDVMVSNILDTVRLEEGRFVLTKSRVRLKEVVQQALRELDTRIASTNVTVEENVPDGLDILADETATRTIVRNLVDNAIKAVAAADGGTVRLEATSEGNGVRLCVRDSGIGFESNDGLRLFDKFYRTGEELTRTSQGTGLGLYLVSMLVGLEGGTVSAHSDGPGHGAEFTIEWPAAQEGT